MENTVKLTKSQKIVIEDMKIGGRYYDIDTNIRTLNSLVVKGVLKIILGGEYKLTDLGKSIKL